MNNIYMSKEDIKWANFQGILDANFNKGVDAGMTLIVEKLQDIEAELRKTNEANAEVLGQAIWEITK